jgi:RimJ/RimL family protein N-acetyltransferase
MRLKDHSSLSGHIVVAPHLETERLLLRPHTVDDFIDCAAMWRDPAIVKYTIGSEAPPQRTWQRLLAYCGHWQLLGFGYWAVESKSTGRYLGELGFADFHRDCVPSIEGIPEIGWALSVEAHGQGYATEALLRVIDWGDAHLGVTRTVCIIQRENTRSIRLARKLGYVTELRAATGDDPNVLLARDLDP